MSHHPEKIDDGQIIDIGDGDGFEVVASGDRYVVRRRGDRHEIWDARERTVVRTFEGARGRRNAWFEFKALEGRQHERRRRTKTRWSVVAGLTLAIALVAGGTIWVYLNRSPVASSPQAAGPATMRVENFEGGYAFRIPQGWTDLQDGAGTEVASPDGHVTVSVGLAGTGEPEAASAARADALSAGWATVSLEAPQQRTVGDAPAVSVGGTGTTVSGEDIRFVAIAVQTPAGVFTIAITVPASADPSLTTPAIDGILASFRVPTA